MKLFGFNLALRRQTTQEVARGTFASPQFNLTPQDYQDQGLREHMLGVWPQDLDLVEIQQGDTLMPSDRVPVGRLGTWAQYGISHSGDNVLKYRAEIHRLSPLPWTPCSVFERPGAIIDRASFNATGEYVALQVTVGEKLQWIELHVLGIDSGEKLEVEDGFAGTQFSSHVAFGTDVQHLMFGTTDHKLHVVNLSNDANGNPTIDTGDRVATAVTVVRGMRRFVATLQTPTGEETRYLVEYDPMINVICAEPPK